MAEVREDAVEIFCSYAHVDEPLRQEFDSSVALMRRKKQIQLWHDRQIQAGDRWANAIDAHLDSSDIIVLFVSRDFLASDYCYEKELSRALEREVNKEAIVIPIIVRDCDWSDAPFSYLQGIPEGKAVTSWTNRDEAWTAVSKALKLTVLGVLKAKQEKAAAMPQTLFDGMVMPKPMQLMPGMSAAEADRQEASAIYAQIVRDAAQHKGERERILESLTSKIFSLESDLGKSVQRPKKRADDAFSLMDSYIRDPSK